MSGVAVYVIADCCDQFVKVGITDNPDQRLKTIQANNPRYLRFIYLSARYPRAEALRIERGVHEVLSEDRVTGEWFLCSPYCAVECVKDYTERGLLPCS